MRKYISRALSQGQKLNRRKRLTKSGGVSGVVARLGRRERTPGGENDTEVQGGKGRF